MQDIPSKFAQLLALSKGDRVKLNDGRIGTVMFKGDVEFANGTWFVCLLNVRSNSNSDTDRQPTLCFLCFNQFQGLELDKPEGRNDGKVCQI